VWSEQDRITDVRRASGVSPSIHYTRPEIVYDKLIRTGCPTMKQTLFHNFRCYMKTVNALFVLDFYINILRENINTDTY